MQASTKLRHWLKLLHSQPSAPSLAEHYLKPGAQQQKSHQQQQRDKAASKGIVISAGGKDMMANALVTAQVGLQLEQDVRRKRSICTYTRCPILSFAYTKPARVHDSRGCYLTNAFACQLKGDVSVQMVRGPFGSLLPIEILYYGDGEADSALAAMLEVGFPCTVVVLTATALAMTSSDQLNLQLDCHTYRVACLPCRKFLKCGCGTLQSSHILHTYISQRRQEGGSRKF